MRADATHDLYERYWRQVMGFCVNQLGSREEAEDAVQSTFLNAHRALQRGVAPESELAWLFKIAHNVCLTRRRSSRRRGRVEAASDLQAMQDVIPAPSRDNADELIRLSDALAHMPDNQRRAILLREWQGLSYHEIADELGLSQSAVETLIFRARRSLATNLETEPRSGLVARAKAMIDLGSLLMAAKAVLGTGAAMKATATAVAVSGAAVIATAPVKPAPVAAAKQEASAAPLAAVESTAPVRTVAPRERPQVSASAAKTTAPARTRKKAALVEVDAPATAAASTPTAPSEPQASAPEPTPVAPKPDDGKDKAKEDKASPPAQITRVEEAKAKPSHAGGPGNGKPAEPTKHKKDKPTEPQPPAAITPVEPVETLPAPLPEDGKKEPKGVANGHDK